MHPPTLTPPPPPLTQPCRVISLYTVGLDDTEVLEREKEKFGEKDPIRDPPAGAGDVFNWIEDLLGQGLVPNQRTLHITDRLAKLFDIAIRSCVERQRLFEVSDSPDGPLTAPTDREPQVGPGPQLPVRFPRTISNNTAVVSIDSSLSFARRLTLSHSILNSYRGGVSPLRQRRLARKRTFCGRDLASTSCRSGGRTKPAPCGWSLLLSSSMEPLTSLHCR